MNIQDNSMVNNDIKGKPTIDTNKMSPFAADWVVFWSVLTHD